MFTKYPTLFSYRFKDIVAQLKKEPNSFQKIALELFNYQYLNNKVYQEYCQNIGISNPSKITQLSSIPFLPISLFKELRITCHEKLAPVTFFESSGTTGMRNSKHYLYHPEIYEQSINAGFSQFYSDPSDWVFLALLPGYLERKNASLVYMVQHLIKQSKEALGGFFLHNHQELIEEISKLKKANKKIMVIGVTHALLDLFEKNGKQDWQGVHILETGGMKGKRQEIKREELHQMLKDHSGAEIFSEYGMTELFSQAYLRPDGHFHSPHWMKVFCRDISDPLHMVDLGVGGALNIIDLANIDSCAFIATEDIAKCYSENKFDVLGRLDNSDARGCNLLIA